MRRTVASQTHGLYLDRNDIVGLDARAGMELRVHRGLVWLTQEGDTRDIVLSPGETFRLDRKGRALVQFLSSAEISLLVPTTR